MSRISVSAAAASKEPQGRQPLWDEMVKFKGKPFTIAMIVAETYVHRDTIRSYLKSLVLADYVEQLDRGENASHNDEYFYRIIANPVPYHAPRLNKHGKPATTGAGVENMWRTMRMLREFTPRDIAAHATTEQVEVKETTVKAYCTALRKVGFLKVLQKARPPAQARYRLINDTGPNPPKIQRTKQVWDPNTNKAYPLEGLA